MRDFKEALQWYRDNQTTRDIGFNPDGMCLKICRTARGIGSRYPSAKDAQDATPQQYRITRPRDIRRGMVLYYDDPNDSNRYGHIVTAIGRVKGFNPDSLGDILVETNSVKSGELVVVRGDYFPKHWGDKFQFASTWLNGVTLDIPSEKTEVQQFRRSSPNWNMRLLRKGIANGRHDLKPYVKKIDDAIDDLPDDARNTRVEAFKGYYRKNGVLKMSLLHEAVANGRKGQVQRSRDQIHATIKSLPDK